MAKRYSHLSEDHKRSAALNLEKRFRETAASGEENVVPLMK